MTTSTTDHGDAARVGPDRVAVTYLAVGSTNQVGPLNVTDLAAVLALEGQGTSLRSRRPLLHGHNNIPSASRTLDRLTDEAPRHDDGDYASRTPENTKTAPTTAREPARLHRFDLRLSLAAIPGQWDNDRQDPHRCRLAVMPSDRGSQRAAPSLATGVSPCDGYPPGETPQAHNSVTGGLGDKKVGRFQTFRVAGG